MSRTVNQGSKRLPDLLIAGHKRFLQNDHATNERLFARLESADQTSELMWIGCSDSRVSPDRILGAEPGDLFVLRNLANIVPPFEADEASVGSALSFGVTELKVKHIVVCGHSGCGGVKALSMLGKAPLDKMLSSWIEYAIPALEDDPGDDLDSLIRTNIVLQAERLLDYKCVLDAAKAGELSIHACYHHIGTGKLQQYNPAERVWEDLK